MVRVLKESREVFVASLPPKGFVLWVWRESHCLNQQVIATLLAPSCHCFANMGHFLPIFRQTPASFISLAHFLFSLSRPSLRLLRLFFPPSLFLSLLSNLK